MADFKLTTKNCKVLVEKTQLTENKKELVGCII